MTAIKVKCRVMASSAQLLSVYYQVICHRKVRAFSAGCRVFAGEWDERCSDVKLPGTGDRRAYLLSVRERIRCDKERLARIVRDFEASGMPYTADDVVSEYKRHVSDYTLFNYTESVIRSFRAAGKIRTSEIYAAALSSFRQFRGGEDIILDCLTAEVVDEYGAWLQGRGLVLNTVSFYARVLRAVYNRAVEDGAVENRRPFRRIYTGVDKTVKRALPLARLRRILALDLSGSASMDFARDMFMMSFYLRGMSFVDMAYLRKSDLCGGYISYRRRKTGQLLTIKWTKEMQHIIDKYPANPTRYLLPVIKNPAACERSTYRNMGYKINRSLKRIASMAGVGIPLTLYCARHSWASAARTKGVPLRVISEGMGHDSETTTRIYLASLDTSAVDKANSLILASL